MAYDDSVRSELRSLHRQQNDPMLSKDERRALQKRATLLIKKAGLWGMGHDAYERWLEGASLEAARATASLS